MKEEDTDFPRVGLFILFNIVTWPIAVFGDSLAADKDTLLNLKSFLEEKNPVNKGRYVDWNRKGSNPCDWPGITCTDGGSRVNGVDLSNSNISGELFQSFSGLSELSYLDLSSNAISGTLTADLNRCRNLKYLNLSHNIINGQLNLTGLESLEVLDIFTNRISGGTRSSFQLVCGKLVLANISMNNFTGEIENSFANCWNLLYLDLSYNNFSGKLWPGFERLVEFSASGNNLSGALSSAIFSARCNLQVLDLSENYLFGEVPKEISNCRNLVVLNLWGNGFTGRIPAEIGEISSLEGFYLGSNKFSREIPKTLLNCSKLTFLDLSRNNFGGQIQPIFGRFTQVKVLVLHGNSYTGGLYSSGIFKLINVVRLDLSNNNFSGQLPVQITKMRGLKYLMLAYNRFNGSIPAEFGKFPHLQALDLSYNRLTGSIPASFGKLSSLLWLMLANNSLTGQIPPELGNCSSLLWLNLANNKLSGELPPELTKIGKNATPVFKSNRQYNQAIMGSGDCLAMKRWIPASYPPFSFVYKLLTRKSCPKIWNRLLKGYGVFPVCIPGSSVRTFKISGYLQLGGNRFSGEVSQEIGQMVNFSMLHLGKNEFHRLPPEIGLVPLNVLNLAQNNFSGEIPAPIGNINCLQNLDLSYNNFSGEFPAALNNLTELSKFNISYNPLITGVVPTTGQLATFEKNSFLGNPLLYLPSFIGSWRNNSPPSPVLRKLESHVNFTVFLATLGLLITLLVFGVTAFTICILVEGSESSSVHLLEENTKQHQQGLPSSSGFPSPSQSDTVKVIRLDKTRFTHADILTATGNFSEDRIIGRGGSSTVYKGILPNGREIGVKKLQAEGSEGEKEFLAEMETLNRSNLGWRHPNLVTLYGWCLHGSEKLLVYEYMVGGSLEELIPDRAKLAWRRRIDIAVGVARALVFLHHECFPAIVHRDVKASNVLLDGDGRARITDFGLARVVNAGDSHVSTTVAGTVGYVAPEYWQTWRATTKGDVYSFGVLSMELATARRALEGGEECLVEWARRVSKGLSAGVVPLDMLGLGLAEGAEELCGLLRVGIKCTEEAPQARPNMKEALDMLMGIYEDKG